MLANGLLQKPIKLLGGRVQAAIGLRHTVQLPVVLAPDYAVSPLQPAPRSQFLDPLDQGLRPWDVIERKIVLQGWEIDSTLDYFMTEECLELRAEIQVGTHLRKIKRLDPHAVPYKKQTPLLLYPDGDREHSIQAMEGTGLPFQERVEHSFGIAIRRKPMSQLFQLPSQGCVIV